MKDASTEGGLMELLESDTEGLKPLEWSQILAPPPGQLHFFGLGGESGLVLSEEGNPAGLSSCSGLNLNILEVTSPGTSVGSVTNRLRNK